MFDKSGGAASGDKQDAMTSAGQTIMKLMLKNQVSGVSQLLKRIAVHMC
jgi:hypothetical protein